MRAPGIGPASARDQDGPDAVEVDRQLQCVRDGGAQDDVDRDRDRHEHEGAGVELAGDRVEGPRLQVFGRGVGDEGRHQGDRQDERERVGPLGIEEAARIDARFEIAEARDADQGDDEERHEGGDPADDHGLTLLCVCARGQL